MLTRLPTSGSTHEQAAGDRDEQACHRGHHEGQAANEEGVIEGERRSTRGYYNRADRGRIEGDQGGN
jgi:hypothetical protein